MLSTLSPTVEASSSLVMATGVQSPSACVPTNFSAITPETVGIRAGAVLLGLVHGETASRQAADIWVADIADPRIFADPAAWVFRDEPASNHRLSPQARRVAQPMLRSCGVLATKILPTPALQDPSSTQRLFSASKHRITTSLAGHIAVLNYWHATRLRVGDRLGFVAIRPPTAAAAAAAAATIKIAAFAVRQSCPDLVIDAMVDGRATTWESLYTAMHSEAAQFSDESWTQHVLGPGPVDLHFFVIGRVTYCRQQASDRQFAQIDTEAMAATDDTVIVSLAFKDSSVYTRPRPHEEHRHHHRHDADADRMPFHHTPAPPTRIHVGPIPYDIRHKAAEDAGAPPVHREAIDEIHFRRGLFYDFNESSWRHTCPLWSHKDAPTSGWSLLDRVQTLFPITHRVALDQAEYSITDPEKIRLLYRHELPWNGVLFLGRDDSETSGITIDRDGTISHAFVVPEDEHGRLYTHVIESDKRNRIEEQQQQRQQQPS